MKVKLFSVLIFTLLISILVSAIAPAAYAADTSSVLSYADLATFDNAMEEIPEEEELPYGPPKSDEPRYLSPTDDWEYEKSIVNLVENILVEAIRKGETSVDISDYEIYPDKLQLSMLKYYSPYISGGIDIGCSRFKDSYYYKINITSPYTTKEVNEYFDRIDAKIKEISDLLSTADTDLDKALLLHDYLVYTGQYDYDNLLAGKVPEDSYRCAGIIMNGKGVCQSYSYAFRYFMQLEGIECHIVSSDAMNHAWNVIRLGDSYYHIDVTWDDPIRDKLGQVSHSHFLLSDSAISSNRGDTKNNHHGWSPDIACNNTKYDDAYWMNIKSAIYFANGNSYYLADKQIKKRTNKGKETTLYSFDQWPTWDGEGFWFDCHSGLWLNAGKLYYNTHNELRYIDIATGDDKSAYTPSTKTGFIFGSAVIGDKAYYILKKGANDAGNVYSIPLPVLTKEEMVTINREQLTIGVNDSFTLKAVVDNPVGNVALTWASDNTDVVTVSANGVVTGCGLGTANITATSASGAVGKCVVTVSEQGSTEIPDNPVDIEVDAAKLFTDVKKSSWFKAAVNHVIANGLMNGTSKDKFEPNSPMNRAMLVTVLWRMEGCPKPDAKTPFTDLKQSWYKDAVAWAYSREIVNGTTDTTFSPTKSITREQMAAILYRYSSFKKYNVSRQSDVLAYPDGLKISPYAITSMAWANGSELIKGTPSGNTNILNPRGKATRAEVATILMRYFELYR